MKQPGQLFPSSLPPHIIYHPLLKPIIENFTKNTAAQYWHIANGKGVLPSHPFFLLTPLLGNSSGVTIMIFLPSPYSVGQTLYYNPCPPTLFLLWTNALLQSMSPHPVSLVELPNCKIKNGKPITTDNSQPQISSTDITAGPLNGDDDSTEYNKASSNESFWEPIGTQRLLETYAITPYRDTDSFWLDSDDDDSTEYDKEDRSWLQSTAYSRQVNTEYSN